MNPTDSINQRPYHFVADENLSLIDYFFGEFGSIQTCAGRHIVHADLTQCDALLVRSVTRVDGQLLAGSAIEFVGSATIGIDHLDTHELDSKGIVWVNAAGCNAQAVAEYVITAALTLHSEWINNPSIRLGIIGLGNVGSRLAKLGRQLGWQVLGYDPFPGRADLAQEVDLDTLLSTSDIVSLHVPLTRSGDYPTYHLLNTQRLKLLQPHALLINTARGAVIAEQDLLDHLATTDQPVVLDVFEHEPTISSTLLNRLALATPHIAGYSMEGKARGTQMIYDAWCTFKGIVAPKDFSTQLPSVAQIQPCAQSIENLTAWLPDLIQCYDIRRDDAALRQCVGDGQVSAARFDQLRKHYPLRREWSAYGISL